MLLLLIGACLLVAAVLTFQRYLQESAQLARVTREVLGPAGSMGGPQILDRLNHWVYENQGFAKNNRYFLLKHLGPTPLQVLETGGDCADKSRLLSALLHHAGIVNTVVMLYSRDFDRPTHTVVETRMPGLRAAADPVFDLVFPDGRGALLGVEDLRDHHELLQARIDSLTEERGAGSKVSTYDVENESYRWPRSVNWGRYPATRVVGAMLAPFVPAPDLIDRPRILEEPVLLVSVLLGGLGLASLALGLLLLR